MSSSSNTDNTTLAEFRRGGVVLLGCFLGVVLSAPAMSAYLAGVFLQPLENEFNWSRAAISLQTLFGVAAFALTAPLVGGLVDRVGVRRVALISFLLFAAAQYAMSHLTSSLLFYYALSMMLAVVASGTTPVVFTKVINAWFDKARGLALGITLLGTGVTATLGPILLTDYVDTNGWRVGYQALALVILVGTVFIVPLIRDYPQLTDGQEQQSNPLNGLGVSVRDAVRSREFLLTAVAFIVVSLSIGGLLLHFIPMMTEYGMTRAEAARTASLMGVSVLVGRIVTGILIDRFFAPRVALVMMVGAGLGFLALLVGGVQMAFITALAVGFTIGAEIDLIGYLAARYFGLKNYGAIYGILYGLTIFGIGIAPLFTGLIYDAFGNYTIALVLSAFGLFVSAGLFWMMRPFPDSAL